MTEPAVNQDRNLTATVIAGVVRNAATGKTPAESLAAVIDLAVQAGLCDAASITMLDADQQLKSVAFSDDLALKADELQYELAEGPCFDAVRTDGLFMIRDLTTDGRWPWWAPQAAGLGIAGSLSLHLFADTALGSLNLYSLQPRDFADQDIENANAIAAHASVVLAYARTERNLWRAIDARNLTGQAQGMLMARYQLTADQAFGVLRRYSQDRNIKLSVIAEQLTTTGQLPGLGHGYAEPS
ncbi:MAG: GAF and ANTAR domain-containing protein [Nakamurella sp.]